MKQILVLILLSMVFFPTMLCAQEEDRELKRHVEVRVELNNESELEGIVVDGRFYEKYDDKKNRWKTMPSRKGSGLRLWHVEKAEGYIFLNYETDIRRIEEIGKKSQRELEELRAEIIRIKKIEQEKSDALINNETKEEGNNETTKEEPGKTGASDELDADTLRKYKELLERFPPAEFNISKTIQAIKIRMSSGVPLSRDHKDYLTNYPTWRKAVQHKNNIPPIKDFTEEQLLTAQELLAKYPSESYSLSAKVQEFATKAHQELPLPQLDAEWLGSLDQWLDAQEIVALNKTKGTENKGTEKKTESKESEIK